MEQQVSKFDLSIGRPGIAVLPVMLLTVSACDRTNSVEYYAQHLDEAKATVESCTLNGKAGDNCTNAGSAVTQNLREKSRQKRDETAKAVEDGSIFPKWKGK